MNSFLTKILAISILCCTLTSNVFSKDAASIEFLHFWVSPGEKYALSIIEKAFVDAGGEWIDSTTKDYQNMKSEFSTRLSIGYPPSAMLWLAGDDVASLQDMHVTRTLNDLNSISKNSRFIYPFAREKSSVENDIVVAPITIHNENWIWLNRDVFKQAKLPVPTSWDEFLSQTKALEAAGFLPLSISDQGWNTRILFTTIIASVGGKALYRRFYEQWDPSIVNDATFLKVIDTLEALRAFRPKQGLIETWDKATAFVIEGKAALQIMGDWAKGEFSTANVDFTDQYDCMPVFGAESSFIVALDVFAFPKVAADNEQLGQALLIDTMYQPEVQAQFAMSKGSVPVRSDVDVSNMDKCAQNSIALLEDESNHLYSPRLTMPEHMRTRVQHVVESFWKDDNTDKETLINELKQILTH